MIAFYNHVFVSVVKTGLLRVNQDRASLPLPPPAEGLRGTSPVRTFIRYLRTTDPDPAVGYTGTD